MLKISIVVCTYNGERYLMEQLKSIAEQSRVPDELVVCDDASSDSSVAIIVSFSKTVSFPVRLYQNETSLGVAKNFEKGIRLAEGDVIVFCDQDDVWFEDKLLLIERQFEESPEIGTVFTNGIVTDKDLQPTGDELWTRNKFTPRLRKEFLEGDKLLVLMRNQFAIGAAMAFRARFKEVVLPIGGYWNHDDWIGNLLPLLTPSAFVEKPLFFYRRHGSNASRGPSSLLAEDPQKTIKQGLESSQIYYDRKVGKWLSIRERLLSLDNVSQRSRTIAQIDDYLEHVSVRAKLPSNRLKRILPALRELILRRYYRYSTGFLSFVKDILMPRG